MKLLLASGSPRRRELLCRMGYEFDIMPCDVDESYDESMQPVEVAKYLSLKKAKAAASCTDSYAVIGSDTIVVVDNVILGKPKDKDDAYKMIKILSNNYHDVITGVTIINKDKIITKAVTTKVHFVKMTEDEIIKYINTDEPYDKAGGYGIQGLAGMYIDNINGDYYNIMGFPMAAVKKILDEINQ